MLRQRKRLSARGVATLSKPGRHRDGDGLCLAIDKAGRRRWTFMWRRDGKAHEIGRGSASVVTLAAARELAAEYRTYLAKGGDPLAARQAKKQAQEARKTFGECADAFIAAKSHEWRNEMHRAQWKMMLETYAAPLRSRPVDEIDTEAALSVLQPIWQAKPETASRLRGRIESVLDAAKVAGHRQSENPARWKDHLEKLLAKPAKLSRGHHAAMPYGDVPSFVGRLQERPSIAVLALEFLIQTAARSGEVLGARWSEVDLKAGVWTVPTARMKACREHRVPLSVRALAVLDALSQARISEFIFPGQKPKKPLSSMALEMVLRRMEVEATPHGFRSAFRDWCGDQTTFPRELAEAALAHAIGDKAEQAYRRSDALEKRRAMMEDWAAYLEGRRGESRSAPGSKPD